MNHTDPTGLAHCSRGVSSDQCSLLGEVDNEEDYNSQDPPAGSASANTATAGTTTSPSGTRAPSATTSTRGTERLGIAGRVISATSEADRWRRSGHVMVYRLYGDPADMYGGPSCFGGGSCWTTENPAVASGYDREVARDRYSVRPEWNSFEFLVIGWVHRGNIISITRADPYREDGYDYDGGGWEASIRNPRTTVNIIQRDVRISWRCGWLPFCF